MDVTTKKEQRLLCQHGWEWNQAPCSWEMVDRRWIDPAGQRRTDAEAKQVVQSMMK